MILKVWEDNRTEEQIVYLRLFNDGTGNVYLKAVNEDGKPLRNGCILRISEHGTLSRLSTLRIPGFQTTVDDEAICLEDQYPHTDSPSPILIPYPKTKYK